MKTLFFSAIALISISPAFAQVDNRYVEVCMLGANGDESMRPYCRCMYGKVKGDTSPDKTESTMTYCVKKYIWNKDAGEQQ